MPRTRKSWRNASIGNPAYNSAFPDDVENRRIQPQNGTLAGWSFDHAGKRIFVETPKGAAQLL